LLLVATVFATQPARAGDRKSAMMEAHVSSASALVARAVMAPAQAPRSSDEGGRSSRADSRFSFFEPSTDARKEGAASPPSARKKLTLLRIDPEHRDIAVQPLVGSVTGAQLSVGF
jgi:hypothetical protein